VVKHPNLCIIIFFTHNNITMAEPVEEIIGETQVIADAPKPRGKIPMVVIGAIVAAVIVIIIVVVVLVSKKRANKGLSNANRARIAEDTARIEAARLAAQEAKLAAERAAEDLEKLRISARESQLSAETQASILADAEADAHAARVAAEDEAARLATLKNSIESAEMSAEEEAARLAAAEEAARQSRLAAQQEAARLAAEEESYRLALIAMEEEHDRAAAEEAALDAASQAADDAAAEAERQARLEEQQQQAQTTTTTTTTGTTGTTTTMVALPHGMKSGGTYRFVKTSDASMGALLAAYGSGVPIIEQISFEAGFIGDFGQNWKITQSPISGGVGLTSTKFPSKFLYETDMETVDLSSNPLAVGSNNIWILKDQGTYQGRKAVSLMNYDTGSYLSALWHSNSGSYRLYMAWDLAGTGSVWGIY
jgi:hypothetical protein